MLDAIARLQELLGNGGYRLVSVEERRDDELVLGRLHAATFARLEPSAAEALASGAAAGHAEPYEHIFVQLKTVDEIRWAERKLAEQAIHANLPDTAAIRRIDELLGTGFYAVTQVLEVPRREEGASVAGWVAVLEPSAEAPKGAESVAVELTLAEELRWLRELL